MATLKQTLIFYVKILSSTSLAGYAYLYYRCKKLREESMDFDMINAKKDTTRPSNVYYGLNWGFRSDNTIENSLDTGDLLFYNYNCMNCFKPSDVLKCYYQQSKLNDDDSSNTAFCFRTQKKLLVITTHHDGQIQIVPYHEFLNKPFIKTVKVRTLETQPHNIFENSLEFVQEISQQKEISDKENKDVFTGLLRSKVIKWIYFDKIANKVVPHYLYKIKVLNRSPFENPQITAQDLDLEQPYCFYPAYTLSNPVLIRTFASDNLRKTNVT